MSNIRRLHPGVYIKDELEVIEMTSRELSARTGISERTLSAIINGKGSITFDVAYKLSVFFDNSVNFWTNLQTEYDMYMKNEEIKNSLEEDYKLIKPLKKYLIENKYINESDDNDEIVIKCRKLVGVNALSLLNKRDPFICFKELNVKTHDDFAQNFWIALAMNEARKKNVNAYDRTKLLASISEIRSMTVKNVDEFYPKLEAILEECGISFVLLPYLTKSNIFGATKWFSKDNVMLAISNRGGRADLFWFTLFHELSHVLMEHRREMLFNIDNVEDNEADKMASDMLIDRNEWNRFIKSNVFTEEAIIKFANKLDILPCIVLGRLHKELPNIVPYGMYDKSLGISYKIACD